MSSAKTFWFSNGNVTTFPTFLKMYKFHFLPLPWPGRNAISPEVFNEFSKTFLWLKGRGSWLLGLRISSAQKFWFSNSNFTAFPTSWKCKNFNFWLLHCPGRNAISPEVFNEFSRTFFSLKEEKGGYCRGKFQVQRHFRFPIATLQLFRHPKNVKISIFAFTLSRQKFYISRSI